MAGQERPGTSFGFFRARRMAVCCIFQNRRIYICNWEEVRSKRREYAGRTELVANLGPGGEIIIYTSCTAPQREVRGAIEAKGRKGPRRGKQGKRGLLLHWMGCTTCICGDLFEG